LPKIVMAVVRLQPTATNQTKWRNGIPSLT